MLPVVPPLMLAQLNGQYGEEMTKEIVEGFRHTRPVTLRVNRLRASREEVTRALAEADIRFEPVSWYEDALVLPDAHAEAVRSLPLYERGGIYLQSLSAMVPPLVLQPRPDETILDMAAAPGGKTTQMAAMTGGRAQITACEKNRIRADRLQFNLDRQGARRCTVMNTDARQLDPLFSFDRILLDAPCTGSGTLLLTGNEEQRRMDESWIKKITATQFAMLTKASQLLRRGHEMVYSTCSIMEQENEAMVERAVRQLGLELLPIDGALRDSLPCLPSRLPETLCIRPTALYEGFFVARLRKK